MIQRDYKYYWQQKYDEFLEEGHNSVRAAALADKALEDFWADLADRAKDMKDD